MVEGLSTGTEMLRVVTDDNFDFRLTIEADIPLGHKETLRGLATGDTVIKYGEDTGYSVIALDNVWFRMVPRPG